MPVTARDVARAARVDPSTVSRVLHRPSHRHRYDPVTVSRVRAAAQRLGYRPSRTAQALRTGKTFNLGLVVADVGNPFWAELASRIERQARARDYRLLVCSTDESPDQQQTLLADFVRHGVDGLIVAPSGAAGLTEIIQSRLPLVTVDREIPGLAVSHVGLDDRLAGRLLAEHLRERGYHQIGVVMPSSKHDPTFDERAAGLAELVEITWRALPSAEDVQRCLTTHRRPSAVVGLNNVSTLAALEVLNERNEPIPGAIGLAGIDDFIAARFLKPAVTVVAQPLAEIAAEAVRILLSDERTPTRRLVRPTLIPRESLRPQP